MIVHKIMRNYEWLTVDFCISKTLDLEPKGGTLVTSLPYFYFATFSLEAWCFFVVISGIIFIQVLFPLSSFLSAIIFISFTLCLLYLYFVFFRSTSPRVSSFLRTRAHEVLSHGDPQVDLLEHEPWYLLVFLF